MNNWEDRDIVSLWSKEYFCLLSSTIKIKSFSMAIARRCIACYKRLKFPRLAVPLLKCNPLHRLASPVLPCSALWELGHSQWLNANTLPTTIILNNKVSNPGVSHLLPASMMA